MTNDISIIGRLSTQYQNSPTIQALLQIIPGWSSADTLLQRRADEIKLDRMITFFNELEQGDVELTEELIQTEDFLHAYFSTLRAAINTKRREKIKLFARLLDSSLDRTFSTNPEEYEELLKVLDDISFREFNALNILMNYEQAFPIQEGQNRLQNSQSYWGEYRSKIINELGVPLDSFNAFMAKIERTGLYTRITGMYYDYSGDIGRTTSLFSRLVELIKYEN